MLQKEALDILKLGHNVYLTGAAGSGKTYVLNQFIDYLKNSGVQAGITASTGIAATHMGGMTIHSWAGLGIKDSLTKSDIDNLLDKSAIKKRMREAKVLIIDEVSMLHGKRLDMVDQVCRAFKKADAPFGGLQVVLCGDLFQLPPVTRGKDEPDFVFNSDAWRSMNLKVCYLSEQYRQEDQRLLDVLSAIRAGEVDESHFEHLQDRFRDSPDDMPVVRLYTHNAAVDEINEAELAGIESEEHTYEMASKGNQRAAEGLRQSCLAPELLKLKLGAEVMFVSNHPNGSYVNGTLGRVVAFDDEDLPVVKTADRTLSAERVSWKLQDGDKTVAEVIQVPLRLAWAITVHKSQGMSLDAAEIDLSKSFEPGMGYVALSRVRSIDGLFIKGMNNTAMIVHPAVSQLDVTLRSKSDQARASLGGIDRQALEGHHAKVRTALQSDEAKMLENYDKDLFEKLKAWRTKEAKAISAPAYIVFSDKTLKLIAAARPKNLNELAKVSGVGAQKLERYGEAVVAIVARS